MIYDVAIIGGSYAGLSAAVPLARARRNIIVIDAGQRRNRFAENSHGFLAQDGIQALEIIKKAREQLQRYKTVNWQQGTVHRVEKNNQDFYLCLDTQQSIYAKKIIIASGVTDRLPDISGLNERWGKSVFHCPYCHGYELNQGNIALLASSAHVTHLAMMLPDWGKTTLLLNGQPDLLNLKAKQQLQERGVTIDDRSIKQMDSHADVIFTDQSITHFDGLFIQTKTFLEQGWIKDLGCKIEEDETGEFIYTNDLKATSVDGVFACGDAARPGGSVSLAVGDGALAGVSAHNALIFD